MKCKRVGCERFVPSHKDTEKLGELIVGGGYCSVRCEMKDKEEHPELGDNGWWQSMVTQG